MLISINVELITINIAFLQSDDDRLQTARTFDIDRDQIDAAPRRRRTELRYADARARSVADLAGDAVRGLLHERTPLHLHAGGPRRERKTGDQRAAVVADARVDATHADLRLLVVRGPALALDFLEVALQELDAGQRIFGVRSEPGALRVIAQPREALLEEEQLPRRGDVQRRTRADDVHHAHRRASRRAALHVHDLIVVAHREVGGLSGVRMELAHERQRELAHADARLDQIPKLEKAHAEAVASRLDAVDQAVGRHRREDAVRGRRVQAGVLRDLLQAERLGMLLQHVEQAHHALDHLDGVFLFLFHGETSL